MVSHSSAQTQLKATQRVYFVVNYSSHYAWTHGVLLLWLDIYFIPFRFVVCFTLLCGEMNAADHKILIFFVWVMSHSHYIKNGIYFKFCLVLYCTLMDSYVTEWATTFPSSNTINRKWLTKKKNKQITENVTLFNSKFFQICEWLNFICFGLLPCGCMLPFAQCGNIIDSKVFVLFCFREMVEVVYSMHKSALFTSFYSADLWAHTIIIIMLKMRHLIDRNFCQWILF